MHGNRIKRNSKERKRYCSRSKPKKQKCKYNRYSFRCYIFRLTDYGDCFNYSFSLRVTGSSYEQYSTLYIK